MGGEKGREGREGRGREGARKWGWRDGSVAKAAFLRT